MKYKSKHEIKYLLFFIFHMFFQHFQGEVPVTSPYRIAFKIENIVAMVLVIVAMYYEIRARRRFDEDCGNPSKAITKEEIGCVVVIVLAVMLL